MELSEFNYELPEELAQTPIEKRDESRLMILDKNTGEIEHRIFKDIIDYLEPGDCLVRNNTRVIPARLYGKKETGANVEFILLKNLEGDIWETMVRPGNKLHVGTTSCRTIETVADEKGLVKECEGDTGIYIYPGYKFKCLDGLITNFHLPESTLLMLVSALAGRENVLNAYNEAVKEKYKFFSFGDAMFIK